MTTASLGQWEDRRVLVTGIGGFVGGGLAGELLDRGARVIGIVRDSTGVQHLEEIGLAGRATVVRGSITEPGLVTRVLNEYEVDSVFHLAAQALVGVANRSPLSTFDSNITGTWQVLEGIRLAPIVRRAVVASSDKAYGNQPTLPYTESTPLRGLYPYDASKVCTDVLARSYAQTYSLPVAVVRCANIYGPGDVNWSRLIPGTIRSTLAGQRPVIRSDGSPQRDYLYLADAVDGYLRVADCLPQGAGEAFNLGTGHGISVLDLVEEILRVAGGAGLEAMVMNDAPAEIERQYLDSKKAHRMLAWQPRTSLTEGLELTVPWYRDYLGADRKLALNGVM